MNPTNVPMLGRGSSRRTEAYILDIGQHRFFISYRTVVAYEGPKGRFRIPNRWGPTTGRHIREMGCSGFETITEEDLPGRLPNLFRSD